LSMQFGGSSSSSSAYDPPRNWGDGRDGKQWIEYIFEMPSKVSFFLFFLVYNGAEDQT
jgi:hypothetical protein